MTIEPFAIVLRPGKKMTAGGRSFSVFVKVQWTGKRLSIAGVEGPMASGNALGRCGQIHPLRVETLADGWTQQQVKTLNAIWDRWHLNDMRAGSPTQREWLLANPLTPADYAWPKSHYEAARDKLRSAGLEPDASHLHGDEPYSYGSAWLCEEVPDDVLLALLALPRSPVKPAWV